MTQSWVKWMIWIGIGLLLIGAIIGVVWYLKNHKSSGGGGDVPQDYGYKCIPGTGKCVKCDEYDDPRQCKFSSPECGGQCSVTPPEENSFKCYNGKCIPCDPEDGPDICKYQTSECKFPGSAITDCTPIAYGAKCDSVKGECVECVMGEAGCLHSTMAECKQAGCQPSPMYACDEFGCCNECKGPDKTGCHPDLLDCKNNCTASQQAWKLSDDMKSCVQCSLGEACSNQNCKTKEQCDASIPITPVTYKCQDGNCVRCQAGESCSMTDSNCNNMCKPVPKPKFRCDIKTGSCSPCDAGSTDPSCKYDTFDQCKPVCQALPPQFDGTKCDTGRCVPCLSTEDPNCKVGQSITDCRQACAGGYRCGEYGCVTCSIDDPSCLYATKQDCDAAGCVERMPPGKYQIFYKYLNPYDQKVYNFCFGAFDVTDPSRLTLSESMTDSVCPIAKKSDPNDPTTFIAVPVQPQWTYDGSSLTYTYIYQQSMQGVVQNATMTNTLCHGCYPSQTGNGCTFANFPGGSPSLQCDAGGSKFTLLANGAIFEEKSKMYLSPMSPGSFGIPMSTTPDYGFSFV